MPVMGMMALGLEPHGQANQTGTGGDFAVGDETVSMYVSAGSSPDVLLFFGDSPSGFLLPGGTVLYFPFAVSFRWQSTGGDTTVSVILLKLKKDGALKRALGL
jgi:hypothetical protein